MNNIDHHQRIIIIAYALPPIIRTNTITRNHVLWFDSDSVPIRVDNCCSQTLSGSLHDFDKTTLTPTTTNMTISDFSGTETKITHTGTIVWNIYDDHGVIREIRIPNSFYIPASKHRLLSPQHWAQESCNDCQNDNNTWCATHKDCAILYWNQGKFKRTIHIDKDGSNTAILWTAPGTSRFNSYMINAQHHLCLSTETTTLEPTTDHLTYHHPPTETIVASTNLREFDMEINHQGHLCLRRRNLCNGTIG
jgi:hypothetical protein